MNDELNRNDYLNCPANIDSEKLVLASILLDNDLYLDASERLIPEDFFLASHQTIFRFMANMIDEGWPVDLNTLSNSLRDKKELEAVGGVAYLASLTEGVPRKNSIEFWVRIVKEKSLLRSIMDAGNYAVLQAADQQDTPIDVLNTLESRLLEIGQKTVVRGLTSAYDVMKSAFPTVDDFFTRRDITGLRTYFPDLDRMTLGLQKGELIVIAARPSMGKTAFAINIAQNIAITGKMTVAVFSLEMSKEALMKRMLSTLSCIPLRTIQTGTVTSRDRDGIFAAVEEMGEAKIFIDDTPSISLAEVRAKAMRQKRSPVGLDCIVVDYIQLMQAAHSGSRHRYENRTQEVSAISRGLKAIAKELDVPVVALSQLSRANEQRPDKRPMLSDLRESGSIEQDADVVAFIHRESYYNRDENGEEGQNKKHDAEIILAKQRNGPTGTIKMIYNAELCAFADISNRLMGTDGWDHQAA